jgi:uncharacterized protein with HEPN domain
MKHPERLEDYLEHIAQAIERATGYVERMDSVAFQETSLAQDAAIRNIEIIGEAASRIQQQAPEFVAAHPELPWGKMRGMRNRMIHNYFDVNVDVVWNTIKEDLPQLKQQIDVLLIERRRGQEPEQEQEQKNEQERDRER